MTDHLVERLIAILSTGGPPGIFLALVLESACVPIPSEIVLPLAGVLVDRGLLGFWSAVGWAVAGQTVGSLLAYCAGRYGGRPFFAAHVPLGQAELAAAERWFSRHGEAAVLIGRLLPGTRTFISVPAGFARMPVSRFLVYSMAGILPWTTVLVWAGVRFGRLWEDSAWRSAFRLAGVAGVLIVIAVAIVYLRRWRPGR